MRATHPELMSGSLRTRGQRTRPLHTWALLFLPAIAIALSGCSDNESAIARGDRLWADSSRTAALAEYRLAVAQRGDEEALSRLAHALARNGDLAEARDAYQRLLELSPAYRDQAVYDFVDLARRSGRRGDAYGAAMAMDAAIALRPEIRLPRFSAEAAAFYRDRGDADAAIAYYRRALAGVPPDSAPPLLYEIGRLEEEQGRCAVATDYFTALREQVAGSRQWRELTEEAAWHTGSCAFRLAEEARDSGRVMEALDHLEMLIRLGVPENLLDQAWLERGELLLAVGDLDAALAAYRQVLERSPARRGQLVERAQRRIDEIRFDRLPSDTTRPRSPAGPGGRADPRPSDG